MVPGMKLWLLGHSASCLNVILEHAPNDSIRRETPKLVHYRQMSEQQKHKVHEDHKGTATNARSAGSTL